MYYLSIIIYSLLLINLSHCQDEYIGEEGEHLDIRNNENSEEMYHGEYDEKIPNQMNKNQKYESKIIESDSDEDPYAGEIPYINRGPPTRGETYIYAATMYTHLYIKRNLSSPTKRTTTPSTPTVLYDQYFEKNRLKTKIYVHKIKAHYKIEYENRLDKMYNHCMNNLLIHHENYTWDQLMDKYRDYKEEQMIRADDRMFNKYIRRMDTVLQSGRYEKWNFHLNTTHKPKFNNEENLLFTERVDQKMILEIRSLARSLRKHTFKSFNYLDNSFLKAYFKIPYNISLYYRYPEPLNYTENY